MTYHFSKTLDSTMDAAVTRVTEAPKQEAPTEENVEAFKANSSEEETPEAEDADESTV